MRLSNYTLSPTRINNAKAKDKLYKPSDGGGLFVEVSPAGQKTWRYRYRFGGVRREVTIGKFPEVGVADARDRHFELRSLLERGLDPLDSRRQKLREQKERASEGKSAGNDFEAFSKRWVRERLTTKSETYRKQVESRLERFIWPAIGTRALNAVRPADVLEIIEARRDTPKTAESVRAIIQQIYSQTPVGTPLTSADLAARGVSADLAVHYVRAGWLTRLARGVFCRPNDPLTLHQSLVLLVRQIEGLHVGGKPALEWHGITHYLRHVPVLDLYGWGSASLPDWFTERCPARYHRKRLFDEQPDALRHVGPFDQGQRAPAVSSPERALLELLGDAGVRQPMQEARELAEGTHNLRADVLRELLQHCASVKTVRLCLQLGHEHSMPWAAKLDPSELPTGSKRRWVSRSPDGLLVLKP